MKRNVRGAGSPAQVAPPGSVSTHRAPAGEASAEGTLIPPVESQAGALLRSEGKCAALYGVAMARLRCLVIACEELAACKGDEVRTALASVDTQAKLARAILDRFDGRAPP